jgi:hypothetical protein
MKQFVLKTGEYAQFRGYVFAYGKPTTVTDSGTILALANNAAFEEFKHEEERKETTEAQVLDACPKCGRVVKQGKWMHQKYCKGK